MGRLKGQQDRVTIQAVAARAGVSAMTVSNVFNRKGKVGEATRERVRAAIDELGYVPSQAARRLVGAAVARIGLIYADVESVFLNAAFAATSVHLAEKGLQLLVQSVSQGSPEATVAAAGALVRSGADGLLLMPPFAEILSGSPELAALGAPAAAIATAGPLPDMSTVRIDNRAAARAVTELLIASGRRRIGVIGGPHHHSDSVARLEGHKDALAAHGMAFDPELFVEGRFIFESGLAAADRLLDLPHRPDAIVAANDDMAAATIWAAHRRGLDLPRELAVTGFDDSLVATRVWPALTTVRQPIKHMVARAIDLLDETLRHPEVADRPRDVVLDFTLIERESSRSR